MPWLCVDPLPHPMPLHPAFSNPAALDSPNALQCLAPLLLSLSPRLPLPTSSGTPCHPLPPGCILNKLFLPRRQALLWSLLCSVLYPSKTHAPVPLEHKINTSFTAKLAIICRAAARWWSSRWTRPWPRCCWWGASWAAPTRCAAGAAWHSRRSMAQRASMPGSGSGQAPGAGKSLGSLWLHGQRRAAHGCAHA